MFNSSYLLLRYQKFCKILKYIRPFSQIPKLLKLFVHNFIILAIHGLQSIIVPSALFHRYGSAYL